MKNQILTEKEYKKLFKAEKRFSTLVSIITSILESESTVEEKLELIDAVSHVATESLCRICILDNQKEQPAFSKGLCHKHYYQYCQGLKRKMDKDNLPLPVPVSRRLYPETCTAPGCDRKHFSRGYCSKHCHQALSGKLPLQPPKSRRLYPETCIVPGCERKHFSHGYCNFHHSRVYKAGIDPTDLESMNQPPRTTRKQLNDESE